MEKPLQPFDESPMGYNNPCCNQEGEDAPFAVCGRLPDRTGGGVLFWAYSVDEAARAERAYRYAGYHEVTIRPGDE